MAYFSYGRRRETISLWPSLNKWMEPYLISSTGPLAQLALSQWVISPRQEDALRTVTRAIALAKPLGSAHPCLIAPLSVIVRIGRNSLAVGELDDALNRVLELLQCKYEGACRSDWLMMLEKKK